jgi:nucleoside-diphosphate-sugar epimerase
MKNRLLLVGGAGTLGSDLVPILAKDYELYTLDNFSSAIMTKDEISKHAKVIESDASREDLLIKIFEEIQPSCVIFLATSMSKSEEIAYNSNVKAMHNVIKSAEMTSLPFIVYIQSFLTRSNSIPISESSQIEAKDSYSVWKLGSELLLNDYKGKHCTIVLSSVISPKLNVGAIPAFISRILKREHIRVTNTYRDYLNPSDFIDFTKRILASDNVPKKLVVGSGHPVKTLEILRKVSAAMNVDVKDVSFEEVESKPSDPKFISLDSTLASDEFKISFSHDFDASIVKTVDNFINNLPAIRLHH